MTSRAKQEPKFQSLLKWIPPYFLVTLANVYMKGDLCVFVLSWTNSDENAGNSSQNQCYSKSGQAPQLVQVAVVPDLLSCANCPPTLVRMIG